MQWILQHKLWFALAIVLVAGGVWYGLSSGKPAPALLTTDTTSTSAGSPTSENADQALVASLLTLRSVTLSGTIFSDPAFISLQDDGTAIVTEPVGRPNPFAPLGSRTSTTGTSASSTSSVNTQLFTPRK